MTTSKKRSSVTVSKTSIDQATQTLQSLPEKPKQGWSLREAIDQMNDVISIAISKGYSYEELVELLRDQGIEISVSSLKNYLTRSKRENSAASTPKASGKPRGRRPKSAQADVPPETQSKASMDAASEMEGDRSDHEPSADETAPSDTSSPSKSAGTPAKKGRRTRSSSAKTMAKTQAGANQAKISSPSNGRKTRRKKDESSLAS
ncbi:MAG: hypothetical protein SFY66_25555 [Oculatellaceae cyanobacterium bins.114]|nr:hypothetical protein [Oculatellaceae cyanobacterium bins.114]